MSSIDRLHLSVTIPIIVACVVYVFDPPAPRYFPLERTWSMSPAGDSPSMGWYGRTAWSVFAAVVSLVVVRIRLRHANRRRVNRRVVGALSLMCLASLLLLSAQIAWHESCRWGLL